LTAPPRESSDILIVGAGIVGLSVAYRITELRPELSITILEKEGRFALHQTGRNSGVIHSGIYYKPGSLKALNCREGRKQLISFCSAFGIPFEICGKVIVATALSQLERLNRLYERGKQNGINCRIISKAELLEAEPHVSGVAAIHVPETGIIDFTEVCRVLAEKIIALDHQIVFSSPVVRIKKMSNEIIAETPKGTFKSGFLINCAGLQSDRVLKLSGRLPEDRIIPFRGEYYALTPSARFLCRNLIYPVPDPEFPFLGVHFTRMIDGGVECGPNAVLAMAREAYRKTDCNWRDILNMISFPGFWKMAAKYWKTGLGEYWRSLYKSAFVRALQQLIPDIRSSDLIPAESGVRAQAVSPTGIMVDDFRIIEDERSVHVLNAPSPAATASLNIGLHIARIIDKKVPARH